METTIKVASSSHTRHVTVATEFSSGVPPLRDEEGEIVMPARGDRVALYIDIDDGPPDYNGDWTWLEPAEARAIAAALIEGAEEAESVRALRE